MLWKSGLLPVTKRLLSLLFVLCLVTLTAVRSEESSSATADATDAATTTTASTTTTEQEKQHSSDCVILPDGTMECPPAAQDDAEPPSQQPEDRIDEDGSDESDLEDGEEDDDEDEEDGEPAPIPTDGDLEDCTDQNETCEYWASIGECEGNPAYMLLNCPHSCKSCSMDSVVNNGHTRQYGKRQSGSDAGTLERIESMHKYMTEQVFVNASFAKVKAECKNREKDCAYWASIGECDNNQAFMLTNCAPACYTCEKIDYEARCPFDRSLPKVFEKEGDLNRFFERLLEYSKSHPEYKPTLFSGPANYTNATEPNPDVTIAENAVVDGPWLMTLEEIFSEEECQHLIQMGYKEGYERSMDVGAKRFDGTFDSDVNPTRTSTNAWCSESCYDDPLVLSLTKRIEDITGIPANNSEYWQLLRYEVGQQYEHHDWIDYQLDRPEGVRILTVFFYLNTFEAGGGTRFPALNVTVTPKRGRVVIWPSTLNHDPDQQDLRTNHAALPVEAGIKYGANAWIHQRDYKASHNSGCT